MAGVPTNIRVEPSLVTLGTDVAQVQTITCVADVSSSLNNKYFFLYTPAYLKYHIWFNVASAGTDPAPAGSTPLVVAISANATAATVATAVAAAIDATAEFTSTASGAIATVTDVTTGYAPSMYNSNAASPAFAYSVTTQGDTASELGFLDGDIEISFGQSFVDVSAHESGVTAVTSIQNGYTGATVTLNMLETTFAKLKKALQYTQGSLVPIGSSGTEVLGIGTSKDFQNAMNYATRLNIHPKRLLAGDKSLDFTAWKVIPQIDKLALSGEKPVSLPLTFKCFQDTSKSTRADIFVIGDYSQSIVGG